MNGTWYQPHEFARIVGMTKRALRYYREKHILEPDYINKEGHTFYSENNLFQAQQIATYRYLEIPVEQIKEIQEHETTVQMSLKLQKQLLQEKILEATQLMKAIENVEQAVKEKDNIPWENVFESVKYAKHAAVENSMMCYYNDRAKEYDAIFSGGGPASCKPDVYKKDIAKLQEMLSKFGNGNVIDIGCGTGFWLQYYYMNCEKFTFLDISPNMLQKCKYRAEYYNLLNQSAFIQEDILKWNVSADVNGNNKVYTNNKEEVSTLQAYDCVFSGFVLGHFMTAQEELFFKKVKQLLKPGGKIFLIDNTWSKWRAKDEHKEDIEKRKLSDGREYLIYKKYFTKEEIQDIFAKYSILIKDIYWGLNFFGIVGECL